MQQPKMWQKALGFVIATAIVAGLTSIFRSRKANAAEA
jgi:hypothetical protein